MRSLVSSRALRVSAVALAAVVASFVLSSTAQAQHCGHGHGHHRQRTSFSISIGGGYNPYGGYGGYGYGYPAAGYYAVPYYGTYYRYGGGYPSPYYYGGRSGYFCPVRGIWVSF